MIGTSVHHAHVFDKFFNTFVSGPDEKFPVKDIDRIVFADEYADGQKIVMSIEVTYEYSSGDSDWVFIQSLDNNSAEFYNDLDDQLQAIYNPFVEPVFINTKIPSAIVFLVQQYYPILSCLSIPGIILKGYLSFDSYGRDMKL